LIFSWTLLVLHPYLCLCLDCLASCLLSLLISYNTNTHAPGRIRTRNPSKRSAADPRLRPLGHWYHIINIWQFKISTQLLRLGVL
jgi:hypothetical protein